MRTIFRWIALGTLCVLFVSGSTVHAQSSEGLQIKPAVIEDKVNP